MKNCIQFIKEFNEGISSNKWNLIFSFAVTFSILTNIIAIGSDLENGLKLYDEFKNSTDSDIQEYIARFQNYGITILSFSESIKYGLWLWFTFGIVYFIIVDRFFYKLDSNISSILILIISMVIYALFVCIGVLGSNYNILNTKVILHFNFMFFMCYTITFGVITISYLSVSKNSIYYEDRSHLNFNNAEQAYIKHKYNNSLEIVRLASLTEVTLVTAYAVFVLKDIYSLIPKVIKIENPHISMDRVFLIRFFLMCLTYAVGIILPYMVHIGQISEYLKKCAEKKS